MEKKKEDDGEWEDIPHAADSEEEEDTTINNSDVVMKYKKAAQASNAAMTQVLGQAKAGVSVATLCALGDSVILSSMASVFRGTDKGVAFPTCVSVNHCVCHNAPAPSEKAVTSQVLRDSDVIHVDLGAHIDGYCAVIAHTHLVSDAPPKAGEPSSETRAAYVIAAAEATLNTAVRRMRPGTTSYEVTDIIERCANHFGLSVVEGVLSHMMKRYIIDGAHCIAGKRVAGQMVFNTTLDVGQVWTLDIALSTGKGKLKEREVRPTVLKASIDTQYSPKLQSAHDVQKEIDTKFQAFPFAARYLQSEKAALGLSELIRHNAVVQYPVLFEKDGEIVAQFKLTLFITKKKIERVTGIAPQKFDLALPPFADSILQQTAQLPLSLVQKK